MSGILAVEGIGIGFSVAQAEVFAIIGPNGAGKTTLFNIISGLYRPDAGSVRLEGRDVTGLEPHRLAALGLSRTFQNLQLFHRMTAAENVMVGRHLRESRSVLRHLFAPRVVWREEQAERVTRCRRPDLWARHLAGAASDHEGLVRCRAADE